jgi:hypothetical protein
MGNQTASAKVTVIYFLYILNFTYEGSVKDEEYSDIKC